MINFYDTSSLLLKVDSLFEENIPFAISSITLDELENIKTSSNKDQEVKYAARKLLHMLDENIEKVNIVIYLLKENLFSVNNNFFNTAYIFPLCV